MPGRRDFLKAGALASAAWALALGIAAPSGLPAAGAESAPIQDNSFLIEEAYNQEARVVQHISAWSRFAPGGGWLYAFTQEWPAFGQSHQLSYTVLVLQREPGSGVVRGLGDLLLNYRYQWLGRGGERVAVAPRLSVVLPTGDPDRGLGAGAAGAQLNFPTSVTLARAWVAHSNAGATWIGESDAREALLGVNLGQSVVWLARPAVNLLLELAWDRFEALGNAAGDDREEHLFLSPGIRWAHDFESGLQIVPGIAAPIGLGASPGENAVLLYLSFEHGF